VALINSFVPFDRNTIRPVTVQVHFLKPLEYEDYIYNEIVQVEFYDFVRPEKTFANVQELKAQIERDILVCKGIKN